VKKKIHEATQNKTTEIINKLKAHYDIKSDAKFAEYLGIATTTLSSWKCRNSLDYDLIYAKCVDIDANWLLSGHGEIVKQTHKKNNQSATFRRDKSEEKYILQLESENKRLIIDNQRKQELISALLDNLANIKKQTHSMDS